MGSVEGKRTARSSSEGRPGSAPTGAPEVTVAAAAGAQPAPVQDGPRERLWTLGAQALSDQELLAVLLGTGHKGNPVHAIAAQLLEAGGGLRALVQRDPHELAQLPGLGPARAAQMLAALELGRRVQRSTDTRPLLQTPEAIFQYVWPTLCALRREVFHVLCLNGRNALMADVRVAEGGVDSCPVDPREVFRAAISHRACGIVLVHNHPSGDPAPSAQDLSLTRHLARAASLLHVKLLDHLVVGDGKYHSMLQSRQLQRIEDEVEVEGWAAEGGF